MFKISGKGLLSSTAIDSIKNHLKNRAKSGKEFSIVVVAEGAMSYEEYKMDKKLLKQRRKDAKYPSRGYEIAKEIEEKTGMDVRISVLGYLQRGGTPSPYDRVLATQFGTAAAELIQTFFIFFLAYGWSKLWKLPHSIAAPAGMIGASNFFEFAVAVAIALFGLKSGATLATVVGVLVEVPVMLILVKIANRTKQWFPEE
ncbi:MAG: hypothetical protein A2Y21_10610 [Clostridiales bacterium GWC2_40_7]|nr:MAG: hypothetical protein A2Y21_10610 [Clostridiales bacterium GWC2_40_7]